MADFIYIAVFIAFFVIAGGLVRVCDRIIGPDAPFEPSVVTAREGAQ